MKHNFFDAKFFKEEIKTDQLLGICDPEGDSCAYTSSERNGPDSWCATIHNPNRKRIRFIAIDKNMNILRSHGELESTCDGMVYASDTRELSFVELKKYHTGGAMSAAVEQLKSTLELFLASHNYKDYKSRMAYACNPVRPYFKPSYREFSREFRKKYKFRLLTQADVIF